MGSPIFWHYAPNRGLIFVRATLPASKRVLTVFYYADIASLLIVSGKIATKELNPVEFMLVVVLGKVLDLLRQRLRFF